VVEIQDIFGNPVSGSPFSTDAEGRIPEQILDYAVYTYEAGLPDDTLVTTYSPYRLRISKEGYADYEDVVEVDRPQMSLEVALQPPPPPVYVPVPASELEVALSRPRLAVELRSPQLEVELHGG